MWPSRKTESFQPIAETDTTMSSSIPCGHHIVIVIGADQIMGHELMVIHLAPFVSTPLGSPTSIRHSWDRRASGTWPAINQPM